MRVRGLLWLGLALAAPGAVGCTSFSDGRLEAAPIARVGQHDIRNTSVDVVRLLERALGDEKVKALPRPPASTVEVRDKTGELEQLLVLAASEPPEAARRIRDQLVGQLIAASDQNCRIYMANLRSNQVTVRMGTDIGAIATGVAGGATSHGPTAGLLASLSGAFTSVGASVDRNVFAETGAELIADAVHSQRDERRTRLQEKLVSLDAGQFPIAVALAEVYRYHGDCSMLGGLIQMQEALQDREYAVRAARIGQLQARGAAPPLDREALIALLTSLARESESDLRPSFADSIGQATGLAAMEAKAETCFAALEAAPTGTALAGVTACDTGAGATWSDAWATMLNGVVASATFADPPASDARKAMIKPMRETAARHLRDIRATRSAAVDAIESLGRSNLPQAELVNVIRAFDQRVITSTSDPMIATMAAAASAGQLDSATAASVAVHAGKGYALGGKAF